MVTDSATRTDEFLSFPQPIDHNFVDMMLDRGHPPPLGIGFTGTQEHSSSEAALDAATNCITQ